MATVVTIRAAGAGLVLALSLATAATAAPLPHLRLTPGEIAGLGHTGAGPGTSGVAGIHTTVLAGDPAKAGPYTIELTVPAHTTIGAHRHRDDRSAVVISGTWYFAYGEKPDPAALKALPPGSYYTEPANAAHFAQTRGEAVTVYITGMGPTDTRYVDASAAPRR